jgi:hypothetical protein
MLIAARSSQDFGTQVQILLPRPKNSSKISTSPVPVIRRLDRIVERIGTDLPELERKSPDFLTEFSRSVPGAATMRSLGCRAHHALLKRRGI